MVGCRKNKTKKTEKNKDENIELTLFKKFVVVFFLLLLFFFFFFEKNILQEQTSYDKACNMIPFFS